jgi:signal transduction histidine kinase
MPASIGSITASRAALATAVDLPMRPSGPIRVLAIAAALSAPFMLLSAIDAGGLRMLWDDLHWTGGSIAAAAAAVWSVRGTTGRVHAVRKYAALALISWMIANLLWLALNVTGSTAVPSISDVFVLAILVPGIGVLVATVRGQLTRAEETAVYLDAALGFLLIGTLLVIVAGPAAVDLPIASSVVALLFPTAFIGLAGAGMIAILALGSPLVPRGAIALVSGSALIGLAYLGWIIPTVNGTDPGFLSSLFFTAGTLTAGYGAVTWQDERSTSPRYLSWARWATRAVSPTAAGVVLLMMLVPTAESVEGISRGAIFIAGSVFLTRQGLLLRERTLMLDAVRSLTAENGRLVDDLRAELERRAIHERRMIQTSRAAAVGDLAAGVAHEVNNPLTGVLGFAEILIEETPVDDPRRADLETIRDEALRAREIVRALRDFASPRPPALVPTDLSTLVRQTVDLVRYSIERRGITIHEDLPELAPILLDGAAVQQATLNILTNARQAMDGAGRLDVAVRADGEGQRITITDNGVGMDATTAGLAFDPFFSGREDEAGHEPAAGLGLSVSIGLIESHGGTISISSSPGRGTTVEIRLPSAQASVADDESQVGVVG